ncbi:MAG: PfkB family carbohydrate kinase, partial [Candidatus Thermoplasmatota archaeon]
MGSGLRAACALSEADKNLKLVSAIDNDLRFEAELTVGAFPFPIDWSERNGHVTFKYYTPLSSPVIEGRLSSAKEIQIIDCDAALVFGMIETSARVKADYLIFDPQQPQDIIQLNTERFPSKHLAIVANKNETKNLGKSDDIKTAAKNLLIGSKADVIITKLGAKGALVTTPKVQHEIGPHPTQKVMPIGSGDTFAAGFAWAWGCLKLDPVEAAHVGSAAAAFYVSTETLP